jgi:peptide/nickel transport system permease protein
LILLFALSLGWLPSAGWGGPLFIIMPAFTLALRPIAYFTRMTRATMIEVLGMDFVRAARARGLTRSQAVWRHALRNALIPVVTLAALWFASLLGGAVIVEVIFSIPGLGRIMYDAAIASDIPLLQAGLVLIVAITLTINTLTDLTYIILNPAVRLARSSND